MVSIVLFNGQRVWCVDGIWYHMPARIARKSEPPVIRTKWRKATVRFLPVWLACYMSNK